MSRDYSPDPTLRVRKRDGTIEPFTFSKLLNSIRTGLAVGGETTDPDPAAARGLAEAVYEYNRQAQGDEPVDAPALSELVDLVLTHTGHTAACMAMRRHRSIRDDQRRRVMVANPRSSDGRFVQRRWNKGHIVRHLRRRHLLDAPASRMIAGRVEQLIFNCGLKVVTTGLVREMIKSELLAWGLLPGALVVKKTRAFARPRRIKDKTDSV
jgi:hypothetical protein